MTKKKDLSKDQEYQLWLSTQKNKKLNKQEITKLDDQLREKIRSELAVFKGMSTKEYNLWHKYQEIKEWMPKQNEHELAWVKRQIWMPKGKSDFRRIQPELIYVDDKIVVESKNIWGECREQSIPNEEPIQKHWEILRTLVSSGRNDGTIGRALRFIVRDKVTRAYLGVICLSSSMAQLTPRNKAIGWDSKKNFVKGGKLVNLANGQTIVPTQPFGSAFLGGKLLSLLCLSDVVADTWKRKYGDTLIEVDTTSLHGEDSQYDNLNPYWESKLGETSGNTPMKPSDEIYFQMREWMLTRYPDDFYRHFVELNESGMINMRENKSRAIKFCYAKLGLKKDEYNSGQKRGVYRSCLYRNGDAFLRDEIEESSLIPAFDNSIEALTEFWRFGSFGDTTKIQSIESLTENNKKREIKRKEMKGQVKGRVDARFANRQIPTDGTQVDWYADLANLTWDETRTKYLSSIART